MQLYCQEKRQQVNRGDVYVLCTNSPNSPLCAVTKEIVEAIPVYMRIGQMGTGGYVNVHEIAEGSDQLDSGFSFEKGSFLFAIPIAVVEKHLPKTHKTLFP